MDLEVKPSDNFYLYESSYWCVLGGGRRGRRG